MMQMDNIELLAIQEEDQNSLEHYGVKGQKWGQRNYQNPDGTYTELGKERRRVAFIKEEKAKKESDANAHQNGIEESIDTDVKIGGKAYKDMSRKELRQAKKRARHNEALRRERREFNREKKAALESGDIAFISKNISKFTNDELDQAMIRYNKMQNLRTMENANKKDSGYYTDKAIEWLNRGAKASNAIANISNSFNDMAKKSAEKRKTQIEADKASKELEYLINPSAKPLTKAEELKNKKQEIDNFKAKSEAAQTKIDTNWKAFVDEEKYKDYKSLSVKDFKDKWGSYDNSGGGKGKGGGDNSGGKDKGKKQLSKEEAKKRVSSLDLDDEEAVNKFLDDVGLFSGQRKNSITGWFSKKNKEDIKGTDYDLDDKRVNIITRKYLNQLKSSPKDYWKENEVRNDQWKKDLKKHDSDVIDKWVKDMKNKYMKEQKLDAKTAEEKAEAYVDSWLDAYDDGDV